MLCAWNWRAGMGGHDVLSVRWLVLRLNSQGLVGSRDALCGSYTGFDRSGSGLARNSIVKLSIATSCLGLEAIAKLNSLNWGAIGGHDLRSGSWKSNTRGSTGVAFTCLAHSCNSSSSVEISCFFFILSVCKLTGRGFVISFLITVGNFDGSENRLFGSSRALNCPTSSSFSYICSFPL